MQTLKEFTNIRKGGKKHSNPKKYIIKEKEKMANKKLVVATAASLQTKSDTAIAAFRNLIAGLKTTNEEAEAAKAANAAQIAALQAENVAIELLAEKNAKIVQNVENLLTV